MISSLLVHLKNNTENAVASIRARPEFELGPRQDCLLPLVLETADSYASRALFRWLNELPDVAFVDVTYVHFEEPTSVSE